MIGAQWYAGRDGAVTVGDRVMIKRDLSGKGVWTVEATTGAHAGKVVAHCSEVTITGVTPKVRAGTQATWMGKRKKPCAWLVGTLAADIAAPHGRAVTFDFHSGRPELFYADNGNTFTAAPVVNFTDRARAV